MMGHGDLCLPVLLLTMTVVIVILRVTGNRVIVVAVGKCMTVQEIASTPQKLRPGSETVTVMMAHGGWCLLARLSIMTAVIVADHPRGHRAQVVEAIWCMIAQGIVSMPPLPQTGQETVTVMMGHGGWCLPARPLIMTEAIASNTNVIDSEIGYRALVQYFNF
jgi:hypothetical protein